MPLVSLSALSPGQQGKVVRIMSSGETNRRITEMGVLPGTLVKMERIAPLGDPVSINIRGYHLSLRKEEAAGIEVDLSCKAEVA